MVQWFHMKETYRYNASWERVRRVFPEGSGLRVLDIGCGDGSLIQELVQRHAVSGIDINPSAVRNAHDIGINAIVGDASKGLPFADHSFDVVLALEILEHIVDVTTVLSEIRRVLTHTGYFIISLPNHFDLRTRLEILCGKGIIRWSQRSYEMNAWEYSHIRFLTIRDARMMLEANGWQIDREQFNFMSGGVLPTGLIPKGIRSTLVKFWPQAWSGKLVFRCRLGNYPYSRIIIDRTPEAF